MTLARDLRRLPKAHLHVHLEAAMRPETYAELSQTRGAAPIQFARGADFTDFVVAYRTVAASIATPQDLIRVTQEAVHDAAADGAVWYEPALLPAQHRALFGDDAETIDAVIDGGMRAAREAAIGFGLMVVADRHANPGVAIELARLAVSRRDRGVVSFGLVGDERHFPGAPFHEAFAIAERGGLICAPHAGELRGAPSVHEAVIELKADRIQHGIRAIEDQELLDFLRERDICLDVCPTSNVALGVVPDWSDHPLPQLLDHGIPCSLNADDPLLFGVGLLDEYVQARRLLHLSDDRLASIAAASIRHSGCPEDTKRAGDELIAAWLATSKEPTNDE